MVTEACRFGLHLQRIRKLPVLPLIQLAQKFKKKAEIFQLNSIKLSQLREASVTLFNRVPGPLLPRSFKDNPMSTVAEPDVAFL